MAQSVDDRTLNPAAASASASVPNQYRITHKETVLTNVSQASSVQPHQPWYAHLRPWKLELVSAAISALTFIGLLATLREFEGQQEEAWMIGYFTRNAVVTAISTVTRTALLVAVASSISQNKWEWFSAHGRHNLNLVKGRKLQDLETFDDASRGFWGSIRLLLVLRGRNVASLGALLMILALTFETFSQNVLSIRYGSISFGSTYAGSVSRSEIYGFDSSVNTSSWIDVDLNFPMKAALSNGMLGSWASVMSVSCDTGECNWPVIPTLAICGGCTDVTSKVEISCPPIDVEQDIYPFCNYTLPDGSRLYGPNYQDPSPSQWSDAPMVFNSSSSLGDIYNETEAKISGKPSRIYAGHLTTIGSQYPEIGLANFRANECALWFCIQSYNVSMEYGEINETLLQTHDLAAPYDMNHTDFNLTDTRNFTSPPASFNVKPESVYGTTYAIAKAINKHFSGLATGNWIFNHHFGSSIPSSDYIQAIWQESNDLDVWIQNLAAGMTNTVRRTAPADSAAQYAGEATSTVGFVYVRWAWILYPASMVVFGLVHLAVTIWQTSRGHVMAWKGNPLSTLCMGVAAEKWVSEVDAEGNVSRDVTELPVSLDRGDDGRWRFRSMTALAQYQRRSTAYRSVSRDEDL